MARMWKLVNYYPRLHMHLKKKMQGIRIKIELILHTTLIIIAQENHRCRVGGVDLSIMNGEQA